MASAATPEQQTILAAFATGDDITVQAGAGTGKSTTMRGCAKSTSRRGAYIAYNATTRDDARQSFPANIHCVTSHSLAFASHGRPVASRLSGARMPGWQVAKSLGIRGPHRISESKVLSPQQIARVVMDSVRLFCYSADFDLKAVHVPVYPGAEDPLSYKALADHVVPYARKAWQDLNHDRGVLRLEHDHYLKAFQLSSPELPYEFMLLDEAQDTNPCVSAFFQAQDAQKVVVGDSAQAIYGWRGAVDALATFPAQHHLALSRSFRFGPSIAAEANKWLTVLDARLRLTGSDRVSSMIARLPLQQADAVLCRTNAKAINTVLDCQQAGVKVALVGKTGEDIVRFAEAAQKLQAGKACTHPELFLFETWGQVQDYVDHDSGGADLKVFVRLVDEHGADAIIDAVNRCVPEHIAQLVVSTAHKAKGREWGRVLIADDFHEPLDEDGDTLDVEPDEAMLAYVAVTRAQHVLDRSGLDWIDRQPALLFPANAA